MKSIILCLTFIIIYNFVNLIDAHGRLWEPASRSTAWRVDSSFPAYFNDMEMFCGGAQHQWQTNGGKCSICGESYTASPKLFEKGGQYYTGRSVKRYTRGQTIDVHVELTANHLGWFEFRICNIDGMSSDATQACLDRIVLKDSTGVSRFTVNANIRDFYYKLVLPQDLTCNQCVFQWKYHTGNSWGVNSGTGQGCLGCGDAQEEFYGCSDVTITIDGSGATNPPVQTTQAPQTQPPTQPPQTQSPQTQAPTTTKFISGGGNGKCHQGDGYYADVASGCQNYYICQFTGSSYETITYHPCPSGTLFDHDKKVCNWSNAVTCHN